MFVRFVSFLKDDQGSTAIEYTVLAGTVGVTAILGGSVVVDAIKGAIDGIIDELEKLGY